MRICFMNQNNIVYFHNSRTSMASLNEPSFERPFWCSPYGCITDIYGGSYVYVFTARVKDLDEITFDFSNPKHVEKLGKFFPNEVLRWLFTSFEKHTLMWIGDAIYSVCKNENTRMFLDDKDSIQKLLNCLDQSEIEKINSTSGLQLGRRIGKSMLFKRINFLDYDVVGERNTLEGEFHPSSIEGIRGKIYEYAILNKNVVDSFFKGLELSKINPAMDSDQWDTFYEDAIINGKRKMTVSAFEGLISELNMETLPQYEKDETWQK